MAKRVAENPNGTFIEGLRQRVDKLKFENPETPENIAWNNAIRRVGKEFNKTIFPFQNRLKELEKMDKEKRGMPMAIALEYQLILKFIRTLDSKRRKNGN